MSDAAEHIAEQRAFIGKAVLFSVRDCCVEANVEATLSGIEFDEDDTQARYLFEGGAAVVAYPNLIDLEAQP